MSKNFKKTAIYPQKDNNFIYPTLGLVGEAGEVAEKIKKILRDKNGKIDKQDKEELTKELGDVLWYLSQLAVELKIPLEKIVSLNIKKLKSRLKRNTVRGSGDNR
ncbi:MAG: nucleoside triphosphate pyrophosphohydrolase family protein [Candidatus Kuenenbacteria bacterium]